MLKSIRSSLLLCFLCIFVNPVFSAEPPVQTSPIQYFNPSNPNNSLFLEEIRQHLTDKKAISKEDSKFKELFQRTDFPKKFYSFGIILYQPKEKRLVVVNRSKTPYLSMLTSINRILVHPRHSNFDISNLEKCRIQIDFILEKPTPVYFQLLDPYTLEKNRFEFGVDGLRISNGKKTRYLLPGDAYVKSILGLGQLKRYVRRTFRKTPFLDLTFQRFQSKSYINYGDMWLPLFRGHPIIGDITKKDMEKAVQASVQFIIKHQKPNGQFLYYYNAARDSYVDHEHPKRDPNKNPYYNILRHSGGTALLLFYHKIFGDSSVLPRIQSAINFLKENSITYHLPNGQKAAYVFYNQKAKLGGTGLALYVLAEYKSITGSEEFDELARLYNSHLMSQIRDSGEFIYYYIYPGREQNDPRSFGFYYSGEALVGLASYYKYVAEDKREKKEIIQKIKLAMDFLLYKRPKLYAQHFTSLPSDSWLMQAVNEMWDIPELRNPAYKKFTYEDADKMASLTYTEKNALYPDYRGAFYYDYGNFPYADGARAEGLLGAFELAVKNNDTKKINTYRDTITQVIWATYHLVNTKESVYSAPSPEMAIGGIRFKHTRQWFRIDTIQHVAAFYLKYLPYLSTYPANTIHTSESFPKPSKNKSYNFPAITPDMVEIIFTGNISTNIKSPNNLSTPKKKNDSLRFPLRGVYELLKGPYFLNNQKITIACSSEKFDIRNNDSLKMLTMAGIDMIASPNSKLTQVAPSKINASNYIEKKDDIVFAHIKNTVIAFITISPNDNLFFDKKSNFGDVIAEAQQKANITAIIVDWPHTKKFNKKKFAHQIIDLYNVDLILGHDSSPFEGVEKYRNSLVIYNPGPLLKSNKLKKAKTNSIIFRIYIKEKKLNFLEVQPITLTHNKTKIGMGCNRTYQVINRLSFLSKKNKTRLENRFGRGVLQL